MKNNPMVDLHASERGNEDASLTIYETLEITTWAVLLKVIGRVRGCWAFMSQATRTTSF